MRVLKFIFIFILITFILAAAALFAFQKLVFEKIKVIVVEQLEQSTGKNIDVETLSYLPPFGFAVKNVNVYDKDSVFSFEEISGRISLGQLLATKCVSAVIKVSGLKTPYVTAGGTIHILSNACENIRQPFKDFSLKKMSLNDFYLRSEALDISGISGDILVNDIYVSSSNLRFFYGKQKFDLSLKIKNILTTPVVNLQLSGELLNSELSFKKGSDSLELNKFHVQFRDSRLNVTGHVSSFTKSDISATGNIYINAEDFYDLDLPAAKTLNNAGIKGSLSSDFSFEGLMDIPSSWKLKLTAKSDAIKAQNFTLSDLSIDANMDRGVFTVSSAKTYPYDGVVQGVMEINATESGYPYLLKIKAENINITKVVKDSTIKKKNIYGVLSFAASLQGYLKNSSSMTGTGYIKITDANLGPMPLLTPLLGHAYGILRKMLPGLKGVEIKAGYCDFTVSNKKIMTDNLMLWGDILNIYAKGYIDFYKNLYFEVENNIKEVEEASDDWQKSLVDLIAGFGKFISKAKLTGTLSNPKWQFEYLSHLKDVLGKNLEGFFKGVFE